MRARTPARAAVGVLALLAGMGLPRASGQEPVTEAPAPDTLTPEERPLAPPGFEGPSTAPPPPPFVLTASAGGGWDSNALFVPDGIGSATGFGRAALTRTWRTPGWTTAAAVRGGGSIYQVAGVGSRYDYGLGLSTSGALGPDTTLTLGGDAGTEYTDRLSDPSAAGLVLPITRTHRFSGDAGIGHRLGARTRGDVKGRYSRFVFDSDLYSDGSEARVDGRLTRAVGTKTSLVAEYGFASNSYQDGPTSQIQTISGGVSRLLSRRATISLIGGADGRTVDGSERRWTGYGDALFTYLGDRSSITARYQRRVAPGYGIGQDRILDLFSLSMSLTLRQWLSLTVEGGHGLNRDPLDSSLSYPTDEIDVTLRASVNRHLALAPQILYRRRGETEQFAGVESLRVGVTLDYVSTTQSRAAR